MAYYSQYDPSKKFGDWLAPMEERLNQIILIKKDVSLYSDLLLETNRRAFDYRWELREAQREFLEQDQENIQRIIERKALQTTQSLAHNKLLLELNKAVEINTEFSHPSFYNRLKTAVLDKRTISVQLINGRLEVEIDMNKTAGRLREWAKAVKEVRLELRQVSGDDKPKKRAPIRMRSHFWAEKFYKPAREGQPVYRTVGKKGKKEKKDITQQQVEKYWKTIQMRFDKLQNPAPFWLLLNHGIGQNLLEAAEAEKIGEPYPIAQPTHFVERAIAQIKAEFQRQFSKESRIANEEARVIANRYRQRLQEVDEFIDMVEREYLRAEEYLRLQNERVTRRTQREYRIPYTAPADPIFIPQIRSAMAVIRDHLGEERYMRAESDRLRQLADVLESGAEITQEKITLGGGVRIRTVELTKEYRGY